MSARKQKATEEAAAQAAPAVDETPTVEQAPDETAPVMDEQPTEEQTSDAAAPSADEQQIPMVVTLPVGQVLNLREGPSREFRVLEQIPAQTEVRAVPLPYDVQVPGWQLIRLGDRVGWVSAEYLLPQEGD